jgi:aminopeptidase N
MENWGLVTYRETCLLVDPETTSAVRKQYIALVVGHELAHQWFGNLVTMVNNRNQFFGFIAHGVLLVIGMVDPSLVE